ncbi:hypothetical protein QOZ80_1AG0011030 [Eleusine coracana subsp. coracana]|nr:hypothetical protein QOZ80_1AG0011030 [Eleusine coracana subsp. coracana]
MESKSTEDLGSLAAAASSFPLLVYDHGEQPDNSQIMFSVADGSWRICQVPELRDYRCLETPNGLVLTVDTASLQSSLWNPQTGEKMALPVMDKALPDRCRCLLSDTITAPDCLVLVYGFTQTELLFCQVRGGNAWFSLSYDIGLYAVPPGRSSPPTKIPFTAMAAVKGKFYLVNAPEQHELGVLSLSHDPEPRMEIANCDAPAPTIVTDALQIITLSYLLESSQELFMVCLFYVGYNFKRPEEVGAYRMDFDKHEWCKVIDIGDRAFILGPANFAASCSAKEHGLKSGCVYFAYDFMGDSNDFHIFDLMEGTCEGVEPTQHVPVLSRKPFWLVPVVP